jgi:hypothetical protein
MKITYAVIDATTSHSTKPVSGQVAGYPPHAGKRGGGPKFRGTAIQQYQCAAKRTKPIVDPLRGDSFNYLDSRLRGNDEVVA